MGTQTSFALEEPFLPAPVRSAPRVWLRRVRIFGGAGEALRDLSLGPGLNVIWAPDADPDERVGSKIGHGAGKTLLCRLVRHVLGEADLASPDDAAALRATFPDGWIDAEVVVQGRSWAVRRHFDARLGSVALPAELAALEEDAEPAAEEQAETSYDDFLEALRDALGDSAQTLRSAGDPWLAALAWISRDQERRFGGALRWRDRASCPSSKLARVANLERLRAIRSLLRVRSEQDVASEQAVTALELDDKTTTRQLADCEREVAWLSLRVARDGGTNAADLLEQPLQLRAHRLELEEQLRRFDTPGEEPEALAAARGALEEAVRAEAAAQVRSQQAQEALASLRAQQAEGVDHDCALCHVPASVSLEQGGRHKPIDRAAAAARRLERAHERAREATRRARKKVQAQRNEHAERLRVERERWSVARERLTRATELERHLDKRTELAKRLERVREELQEARVQRERVLREHGRRLGRLADVFDFVVRRLAGQDVRGHLAMTTTGLEAQIRLPDGRAGTSPALRVLETLALDLTALILACEDRADLPGLWIHDSPREADLARSHYDALYRLIGWLEESTNQPGFQYIVTTTTRPPASAAFRALKLGAASNDELLLRQGLRGSPQPPEPSGGPSHVPSRARTVRRRQTRV